MPQKLRNQGSQYVVKTTKNISIFVIINLLFIFLSYQSAWGLITGSSHDFKGYGWSGGQICIVCHTPHNATPLDAPLWNHDLSVASYTLYSSSTFTTPIIQPGEVSKACLSCHDGTIALDAFGTTPGNTTYVDDLNLAADLNTNLSNDHPIGFLWDDSYHGNNVYGLGTCATCHTGGVGSKSKQIQMFNGRMECPTCHDVHNSSGFPDMLVMSNAGSNLCQSCHWK